MADLRELYQEVILDHNRRPRNFRTIEGANRHAEGYNPLCGDRLSLYLKVEDGMIKDASFQGSGCAISKASASMMTDSVKGKTLSEARDMFEQFHQMVTGNADPLVRSRTAGQAGRVRRRPSLPGAREMREPRLAHASLRGRGEGRGRVDRSGVAGPTAMADKIIKLTDERAARADEEAHAPSAAGATARRDLRAS